MAKKKKQAKKQAKPQGTQSTKSKQEPKRLYRSRNDKVIAGVCAGIAEYFGIDPAIVRLLAIVAFFFSAGFLILIYIGAWIVIKENPKQRPAKSVVEVEIDHVKAKKKGKVLAVLGIILILIGVLILLENFFSIFDSGIIAPAILIGIGFYLMRK